MVEKVKKAFPNVIVVMTVGGIVDTKWFRDCDEIQSVLMAWQGGMEGGLATADILCGDVNPSGQLSDTYAKNLEDYLSFDKIICCGGSWMVKGELVNNGEFDKIRELTAEARKLVDSIRK